MLKACVSLLAGLLGLSVSAQQLSPGTNAPPGLYLSPAEWWAVTNGMAPGDLEGLANLTTQGGGLSPAALAAIKAGLTADDVSAIAAMAAQVLAVQAQTTGPLQPTQISGSVTVANHVLNVNLGGQTSDEVGLAAIGHGTNDFWTGSYFPNQNFSTIANLPWSDKTGSGIGLLITNAPGDWANGAIDPMLRTYTYSYSGDITLTLTNVPAGSYALYLYGHGPTTDDSIFSVTSPSNGLGTLSTGPNWQSSTWSNGAQYVVFPGLSVSSGQAVTVDVQVDSLAYALASGLQLLPYSNAVPDLLHETKTNRVPFMGVPFVVTGVIEAEQFDQGGRGVGYQVNDTSNATTAYRVCNLCITTNNGDPMGGGFCVDKLRANEWLSYSIDVRVSQNYYIEPRLAGIGTGGTFSISFSTNGVTYVTTNLTVPTTSWTNLLAKNVPLQAGTNIMTVTMLTNGVIGGSGSGGVARLNYISVYPSWNEGATNAGPISYVNNLVANASDWATASNNTVAIQNAIDSLTSGGTVSLTQTGRFYLASRVIPNEYGPEYSNSALYVYANNLQIRGAGKDKTTLVAHDRDTTLLYVGYSCQYVNPGYNVTEAPVTNFTLSGLSLEGSPHLVYTSTNSARAVWEDGWLVPSGYYINGTLLIVGSYTYPTNWVNNALVTNCLFRNPSFVAIGLPDNVSKFMCRSNDFRFRDGTNGAYFGTITDTNSPNTTNFPSGNLGIWAPGAYYGVDNLTVMECTFNGNVTNTSTNATSPAFDSYADGMLYYQYYGGNWFAARNAITNYGLEAIQWNSGPAAAVQNVFSSVVNTPSTCALNIPVTGYGRTVTTNPVDLSFGFVGNVVTGGRPAVLGVASYWSTQTSLANLVVSGNTIGLLPWNTNYNYGAACVAELFMADRVDIAGNTLQSGDMPVYIHYSGGCTNLIVLQNDFSGASLWGIQDASSGGHLLNSLVLKNRLSCGTSSFHLQAPPSDGAHWFLIQNTYLNGSGATNGLLVQPASMPVQYQP